MCVKVKGQQRQKVSVFMLSQSVELSGPEPVTPHRREWRKPQGAGCAGGVRDADLWEHSCIYGVHESLHPEVTNSDPQLQASDRRQRNEVRGNNVGGCWPGRWVRLKGTTSGFLSLNRMPRSSQLFHLYQIGDLHSRCSCCCYQRND